MSPFSLQEIQAVSDSIVWQKPQIILASDNIPLAYYTFVPQNPRALVILYHGAGLYANKSYQWVARELCNKYNIATFCVDMRGYGYSGGPRGDTPTIEAMWDDVSTIITLVRKQYSNIPLYLVGHSSGAALILNYTVWDKHLNVDGLILLAPYLGPLSGCARTHENSATSFVRKANTWVYILNGLTGGRFFGHLPAVLFNYSDEILRQDPRIIPFKTYFMSCATTPYQTKEIFQKMTIPTAIIIGGKDEQFIAETTVAYQHDISTNVRSYAEIVPDAKHISILVQAPELIAQGINKIK